jgi:2-oxo-4-hydroxy-4-carboxy--5-ureidoimidazoline (OHCU) decarboxylase
MGFMLPSESGDLEDIARQLAQANPDEQAELAPQAYGMLLDDIDLLDTLTPAAVTQFLSMLDDGDPGTRSVGVFVAAHVAAHAYADEYVDDRSEVTESVFNALGDESPVVRQTAANSNRLGDIVEEALDESEYRPLPRERIAATLFELLQDPDRAVRRRIGGVVFAHGADLIAVHSDPEAAVETLVNTLEDPPDAHCTYTRSVVSPRHAALVALDQGFEEYDGSLLADHADTVAERLEDDRYGVRSWAVRLLDTLVSAGVISVEDIADDVVTAAQRNDSGALGKRFPRLALRVALAQRSAVDPVYEHLRARFMVANTRTDYWQGNDPDLVALSRLVRAVDQSFDPAAETLAATVARDTAATDGTDPLVLLASDNPEFVADQLRQGYQLLVDDELDHSSRFYRDLVVNVADRNPTAIETVPEILAENLSRSEVRKTMAALVDAHPDLTAHIVPDAYARAEWDPPLRYQHSQLIEKTAEHWETVSDSLGEALIETVGTDRSEKRRRFAIRALIALDQAGLPVLPERFSPFVDLYDQGAFDEDSDPVDPLETDAAEGAGLR